jgi:hypothetical protein
MKRLLVLLAVAAVFAVTVPLSALGDTPQPPPGCGVVVTTPAATTGSAQGQANKVATFNRLCT